VGSAITVELAGDGCLRVSGSGFEFEPRFDRDGRHLSPHHPDGTLVQIVVTAPDGRQHGDVAMVTRDGSFRSTGIQLQSVGSYGVHVYEFGTTVPLAEWSGSLTG
jgi:hypothetical protein